MSTPLPPDPYKALDVSKDASLPEIRSAHRKKVLKCHPDKVQDAALKAVAQDEFQKVQQAYELLSDDTRRTQYDEQVKLFELRREMGRGNPHKGNPFDFEIRTAEPRANTFASRSSKPAQPQPQAKVYSHTPPRSYEDVHYEEPRAVPRKTASYESADRRHSSSTSKEENRRRHEDDERARTKLEKESKRSIFAKKEKARDKDRKKSSEDKYYRSPQIESDSEDDHRYRTRSSRKESSRPRDLPRYRQEEQPRAEVIKSAPLDPKWDGHKDFAAAYMQASRQKAVPPPAPTVEDAYPAPPQLRRAETSYQPTTASYSVRHVPVQTQYSDDEAPRRSSARRESSRKVESSSRMKDKSSKDRSRRSSPTHASKDPYIVEAPSAPPPPKMPSLKTYNSAPPTISVLPMREKPSRSKTHDYPREAADSVPPLPRASTFHGESRGHADRSRERSGGSRLRQSHGYDSDDSEVDISPRQSNHRRSHSPPPRQSPRVPQEPAHTQHTYRYEDGRTVPIASRTHREDLRHVDNDRHYSRDRSESPNTRRSRDERPPTSRTQSNIQPQPTRGIPVRSQTTYSYPTEQPPIVRDVRPSLHRGDSYTRSASSSRGAPMYGEVKYAPVYKTENVAYTAVPPEIYGTSRTREPESYSSSKYANYPQERRRAEGVY